jgi:hypothetical protein
MTGLGERRRFSVGRSTLMDIENMKPTIATVVPVLSVGSYW